MSFHIFFFLRADMSNKPHKAFPDHLWNERLKRYAEEGVWPKDLGNRPAVRQVKWYNLYKKVNFIYNSKHFWFLILVAAYIFQSHNFRN